MWVHRKRNTVEPLLKDTSEMWTPPKCGHLPNQDTWPSPNLLIRTHFRGPRVSVLEGFHCIGNVIYMEQEQEWPQDRSLGYPKGNRYPGLFIVIQLLRQQINSPPGSASFQGGAFLFCAAASRTCTETNPVAQLALSVLMIYLSENSEIRYEPHPQNGTN